MKYDPTILRGHSPQNYTREAIQFGRILERCKVVQKCNSGAYNKKGGRKRDVVIRQEKIRNNLEVWFRDGEGTYKWHIVFNPALDLDECVATLEGDIRKWNPGLIFRRHGDLSLTGVASDSPHGQPVPYSKEHIVNHASIDNGEEEKAIFADDRKETLMPTAEWENLSSAVSAEASGEDTSVAVANSSPEKQELQWTYETAQIYKHLWDAAAGDDTNFTLRDDYVLFRRIRDRLKGRFKMGAERRQSGVIDLERMGLLERLGNRSRVVWKLHLAEGKVPDPESLLEELYRNQKTRETMTNRAIYQHGDQGDKDTDNQSVAEERQSSHTVPPTGASRLVIHHVIEGLKLERRKIIDEWNTTVAWTIERFSDVLTEEEMVAMNQQRFV